MSSLAECRAAPDVQLAPFIDDCVEDACAGDMDHVDDQFCVTMDAVTATCEDVGVVVSNMYRVETQCSK